MFTIAVPNLPPRVGQRSLKVAYPFKTVAVFGEAEVGIVRQFGAEAVRYYFEYDQQFLAIADLVNGYIDAILVQNGSAEFRAVLDEPRITLLGLDGVNFGPSGSEVA